MDREVSGDLEKEELKPESEGGEESAYESGAGFNSVFSEGQVQSRRGFF